MGPGNFLAYDTKHLEKTGMHRDRQLGCGRERRVVRHPSRSIVRRRRGSICDGERSMAVRIALPGYAVPLEQDDVEWRAASKDRNPAYGCVDEGRATPARVLRSTSRSLERLVMERGRPRVIVSDNGCELTSTAVLRWPLGGLDWHYIALGKVRTEGLVESFNSSLRDECVNEHVFLSLADARATIEAWRDDYNYRRPIRASAR